MPAPAGVKRSRAGKGVESSVLRAFPTAKPEGVWRAEDPAPCSPKVELLQLLKAFRHQS